jgi:glycosyltransferase involved in cell wall biosynthesis
MTHICFVGYDLYPPWDEGMRVVTRNLKEALQENTDLEISVVSSVKRERIYLHLSKLAEHIIKRNVYLYELDPILNISMLKLIKSINKRRNIDLLHLFYANHPLFLYYGKLHKKPVVAQHFGNPHINLLKSLRIPEGINTYITTSSETGYFDELGIKNVYKIKPPINTDTFKKIDKLEARRYFGLSEDDFIILYMGGLNEMKVPLKFITTINDLLDDRKKILLMGRGRSNHAQKIQQLAKKNGIDKNVIIRTETLNEEQKALIYNSADVLILPFSEEIRTHRHVAVIDPPITMLEAMSCGIPIIAPDTLSIPDIIKDGYNGFITPSGDFKMLKEKITKLIANENKRLRIGENARETILNEFSYETVALKMKEVYEGVLNNG